MEEREAGENTDEEGWEESMKADYNTGKCTSPFKKDCRR